MKPKIDSLESKRLVMEVRKEHHGHLLYDLFCDQELYHYIKRNVPKSAEWLAKTCKELETLISSDGKMICLAWVAKDKTTNEFIGLFEMSIIEQDAFVAYTVFKKHWGKGFALEATQSMIEYVAKNYSIKRFVIEMDTRNRSSIKVAEKLGFQFVKVINNAAFIKNFVSHEFQFEKTLNH